MHFLEIKISKTTKSCLSVLSYFLSLLDSVGLCHQKRLKKFFFHLYFFFYFTDQHIFVILGLYCYKYFLTSYQMMLVMVHGHIGANVMYLVVWVQGSDNAYVIRIGTVQKKEYSRQRLALLTSVQQMEVLYSAISGNIFYGYLIHQYPNFLITSVIINEAFY